MWPRAEDLTDRYRATLVGLALGDALGTTLEFRPPGTFTPITDLVGGGPFHLPAGAWTDDTSMALCLAESLVERGGFDAVDQLERYVRWWRDGHLSSTGRCFDIGGTVRAALERFERTRDRASGSTDPSTAGNGSLMRLAPVVLAFASNPREAVDRAAASSRTTHGALEAVDACRYLAALLVGALRGHPKDRLLSPHFEPVPGLWSDAPLVPGIAEIASGSFRRKEPPAIRGTGYVVESLEAALWAFDRTSSFEEGALLAVNLGDDADTTGAVYGQLAGAYYGLRALPEQWLSRLVERDLIERLADGLFHLAWEHVHPSGDLPALGASLEASYRATVLHHVEERAIHRVATPRDGAPASPPDWDLPTTFYVITASNPRSEKRSPPENAAADRLLQRALLDRGASVRRMDGASPDASWYERGWAVWNIPAGTAARIARDFGQNAFFVIDEGRRYLGAGVRRPERAEGQPMEVERIVTVEDAIILAAERHRGQRDKVGEPYILHPLRVALRLRDDRERLGAVLHDVVEDTGVTVDELRERGLDENVVAAIETLTQRDGEDYRAFIERVAQDPIARAVKLADLADNLDPDRLAALPAEEQQRLRAKYEPARERLLAGPEDIRRQLDLPGARAAALGHEALAIVNAGEYVARSGRRVSIAALVDTARDGTVEYGPDGPIPMPGGHGRGPMRVEVANATTLAAARRLLDAGQQPAALNFASATTPGGGFLTGARAQEEYLARSSALLACLRGCRMYAHDRARQDPFYDDFVIYSPDVPVFRDDDGELLEEPWRCTILTSPAVHARGVRQYVPSRVGDIEPVMRRRIGRVLAVAAKHRRHALVLGAWGCGAFGNGADMVAGLFQESLEGPFAAAFSVIVFAVTDWSPERRFIGPFERRFGVHALGSDS